MSDVVALDRVASSPEQIATIDELRQLSGLSEQDTRSLLITGDPETLRRHTVSIVYAT